jgi:integrase/recombinase XerD
MSAAAPSGGADPLDGVAQIQSAKQDLIDAVCRLVRRAGLDYEGWRYLSKRVREACQLRPGKKGKRLPRVLTGDYFRRFYLEVDRAGDSQHGLMLRLLFYTALRVAELVGVEVADVDLQACHIRVNQGKGAKDRTVLFARSLAVALRAHVAAHPANRWLFQTRRNTRYSTRRVQQIVSDYAALAGISATPHTFRHQAITWLTRESGLADAELQLLTGHAQRESLAIYQHVALDGALEAKYQEAMRKVDL